MSLYLNIAILKHLKLNSTNRRKDLTNKIDVLSTEIPIIYLECYKNNYVYLIYISSSCYNYYNYYNSTYNIQIIELE
jgi:hypothetical protein